MNRRSFVTLLGSGIAALCLPEVEWVPTAPTSTLAGPRTKTLTDIAEITTELLHQMALRLPNLRGRFVPGVYQIGHESMTSQWNAVTMLDEGTGVDVTENLVPAAKGLARAIGDQRLDVFGALQVNIPGVDAVVATDERSGLAVRGIRMYDICPHDPPFAPGWRYRFDVLGGRA